MMKKIGSFSLPGITRGMGYLAAVLCEVGFGFSFLFTKTASENVHPVDLIAWRFAVAALLLAGLYMVRVIRIARKNRPILPLLGMGLLFPGCYYLFEAFGIRNLTASESGMLVASVPAITLLLSALFLGEKPGFVRIAGIGLSIIGVGLCVVAKMDSFAFSPRGYLLLGCGILSFCFFTICTKKSEIYSPVEKTFFLLTEGFMIYFLTALIRNGINGTLVGFLTLPVRDMSLLSAVCYLGPVCSIGCMFLCNYSISKIGPACFTSFIGVETIVAITAGILILGEPALPRQLLGAVLIIAGVYLANARN